MLKNEATNNIPKVPKPISGISNNIGQGGYVQRTYIPELDAAVDDIVKLQKDFTKLIELKGMFDVNFKLTGMLDILTEAQEHLK